MGGKLKNKLSIRHQRNLEYLRYFFNVDTSYIFLFYISFLNLILTKLILKIFYHTNKLYEPIITALIMFLYGYESHRELKVKGTTPLSGSQLKEFHNW